MMTRLLRRLSATIGLPPGAGIVLDGPARVRFIFLGMGSVVLAVLDMIGVATMLPLMQLLTGADTDSGMLKVISDLLGGDPSRGMLVSTIAVGIIVVFGLKGVLTLLFRWWQLGFVTNLERRVATRLLRAYLAAPFHVHVQRGRAELIRAVEQGPPGAYSQTLSSTLMLLTEALTILGLSILLLIANPLSASVALLYFGTSSLLMARLVRHRLTNAGEMQLAGALGRYRALTEALTSVKEIKIRHKGEFFVSRFWADTGVMVSSLRRSAFYSELPKHGLDLIFVSGLAVVTALVYVSSATEQVLPTLALFAAAGSRMVPSMTRMLAAFSGIRYGLPAMRLLVSELHEYHGPESLPQPAEPLKTRGDLRVENLSFGYPGASDLVLDNVSFTVPFGTSLAVVGPSGAGKSTLVDLILGLHVPQAGQISIDGVDIQERLDAWQCSIGVVPQDLVWLDDSLAANIAFATAPTERDESRVRRAIQDAHLEDLVEQMPGGIHAPMGENGLKLSGGQRQRVGIARALYGDPLLLVLDEATSALDNLTESRVAESLSALQGKASTIIVAHRLSTVRNCDLLIYLEEGKVQSAGTFDEVRNSNPMFAELVRLGSLDAWEDAATQS